MAVKHEIFRRGAFPPAIRQIFGQMAKESVDFFDRAEWVTRSTMIAVTTMMLLAETYGFKTPPLKGCDPVALHAEFNLPDEIEFVALLCIGFREGDLKPYSGRFAVEDVAFADGFETPYRLTQSVTEGR